MNLIFCLFQSWLLLLVYTAKFKFEIEKKIKFIQLNFYDSILQPKARLAVRCVAKSRNFPQFAKISVVKLLYDGCKVPT